MKRGSVIPEGYPIVASTESGGFVAPRIGVPVKPSVDLEELLAQMKAKGWKVRKEKRK